MRASLWRTLADLAEPITAAVRAEIGEAAAHRLYRAGLRTVAGLRVSARAEAGGWLVTLAGAALAVGRVAYDLARRIDPVGVPARPVAAADPTADPAPTPPAVPTLAPAAVPDLTGGAYLRAVQWEPDGFADPLPAAPTAPASVWGVDLPRSRRLVRPVAPPADPTPLVPVADATPVVPSPAPADEWADATAVELTDPPAEPAAPTPPAAPVKPTRKPRTRKPAAPKVMSGAARTTAPPAVPTFASIDAARAALGSSDIKVYGAAMDYINAHVPTPPPPAPVAPPAVSLSDVRPMPLVRFAAQLDKGSRFSGAASARKGWATDSKGAVRVPTADREAIAAKIAAATGRDEGRAPDVETVLPTAIDPRPFVPTARGETETGLPAVVLTREDGETRTVDVRLYRTILHHSPKGAAVYARQTHGRQRDPNGYPLAVFAGDPTTYTRAGASGLLMPLTGPIVTADTDAAAA